MAVGMGNRLHPSSTFQQSLYNQEADALRVSRQVGNQAQNAERTARDMATLRARRQAMVNAGAHPSSLPRLDDGMSPTDIASTAHQLGVNLNAPLSNLPTPTGAPVGTLAGATGPMGFPMVQRDNPRDVLDAYRLKAGIPLADQADANAKDAAKVAAVAGTGDAAMTQYGTASSRMVPAGTPTTAAIVSNTGVIHPQSNVEKWNDVHGADWQQKLVAQYPQIGVLGSPENAAFVAAVKGAQTSNTPGNPFQIAQGAVGLATASRVASGIPVNAGPAPSYVPPTNDQQIAQAATKAVAPVRKAVQATGITTPEAWYGEYVQPFKDVGNYVGSAVKSIFTPPSSPAPVLGNDTTPSPATTSPAAAVPQASNASPIKPWGPLSSNDSTGAPSYEDMFGGSNDGPKTMNDQYAQSPAQDEFKKRATRAPQSDWMAA